MKDKYSSWHVCFLTLLLRQPPRETRFFFFFFVPGDVLGREDRREG